VLLEGKMSVFFTHNGVDLGVLKEISMETETNKYVSPFIVCSGQGDMTPPEINFGQHPFVFVLTPKIKQVQQIYEPIDKRKYFCFVNSYPTCLVVN
jgi:hypothetical protein